MTLRGAMPPETAVRQCPCADIDGFSLHAAVRVEAHDRTRLEHLCRYITRPALSDERVQLNAAGQVQLELKTPWRDGTTQLVMSPLEFMQRLAALVPRPGCTSYAFTGCWPPTPSCARGWCHQARRLSQTPPPRRRRMTAARAATRAVSARRCGHQGGPGWRGCGRGQSGPVAGHRRQCGGRRADIEAHEGTSGQS
jgi:hypothetical protein